MRKQNFSVIRDPDWPQVTMQQLAGTGVGFWVFCSGKDLLPKVVSAILSFVVLKITW